MTPDSTPANQNADLGGAPSKPTRLGRTGISAVWTAVVISVVLGVALVDFIVQNTRKVRIEFFGASGTMPVAVALLAAALAGAFVVVAVGVSRVAQLRIAARRKSRKATNLGSESTRAKGRAPDSPLDSRT